MPRRSISDGEIALIKAMLARKMKNKDIQFFFNRPDRSVNSGRITGIGNGSYGKCWSIQRASDTDLDAFIADHAAPGAAGVPIPVAQIAEALHPTHAKVIGGLFVADHLGIWRFTAGETDQHECKANFGFRHSGPWLKAVAALANNRGGYILFGVHDKDEINPDKSYAVIGLKSDEFAKADPVEFTKRVKAVLDPTPRIQIAAATVGGMPIGVIYVERHASRPVIATKPEGDQLKEGDIVYRYPGQSNRIKYSDLRALLDERDAQARRDVMPLVERILALGPKRAMVADLEAGLLDDGKRPIVIDRALIDRINFIREGEFDEQDGAPTLKLVGDVMVTDTAVIGSAGRGVVTDENVLTNFLELETVFAPPEYIRFAVAASSRDWLPIFYFATQAGLSRKELTGLVAAVVTTKSKRKKDMMQRAVGLKRAFAAHTGTPALRLQALIAGEEMPIEGWRDAANVSLALQGLPDDFAEPAEPLFLLLKRCRDVLFEEHRLENLSSVYRAAARLDEIYFSPAVSSGAARGSQ